VWHEQALPVVLRFVEHVQQQVQQRDSQRVTVQQRQSAPARRKK